MSNYLPSREEALDSWIENFKGLIAASPTTYGLVVGDATSITNAYNAWHSAFLLAVNPGTRTSSTVMAKNTQKANVLGVVRGYAATIRANRAVANDLKNSLGLHVRDADPTPVPPPSTKPVLKIARTDQGFMDITASDEATSDSRARPAGTVGLLLYQAIGTEAVNSPSQATFLTFVGRPSAKSTFTMADRGKTVTFFARWTNARGEVGPWSNGLSGAIAA